jgi:microcystin-dependent protein
MPDTFTPTLDLTKVGINESDDTWGQKLNENVDKIDAFAAETRTAIGADDTAGLRARIKALEEEAKRASWVGEIRIHSGTIASVANIPGGVWKLCDGQEGRPNLIDKFVMGAGGTTAPGTTGGAKSWTGKVVGKVLSGLRAVGHALTVGQMPWHTHAANAWTDQQGRHDHTLYTLTPNLSGGVAGSAGGYGFGTVGVSAGGEHGHNVGVSIEGAGGNEAHDHALPDLSHDHDIGPVPTLPPYLAFCYVIRVA